MCAISKKYLYYSSFFLIIQVQNDKGGNFMASFVIHNITGEQFLKKLEQKYGVTLTEKQRHEFLLGNLIVDSTRLQKEIPEQLTEEEKKIWKREFQRLVQEEKIATHFRDKEDYRLCIQVPNLEMFLEKYKKLLESDFSALGYFYHIYTDKLFFNDLFCAAFDCLDADLKPTKYADELMFMLIKKSGKIEKQEDVWAHDSNVSIYQDYTVMNRLMLEFYGVSFDSKALLESAKTFTNPGISEVDYQNIGSVIQKTKQYIEQSYGNEGTLHVFSEEQVKNFIVIVSGSFIDQYYPLFEKLVKPTIGEKQKVLKG